jgi:hypothetical protein
MPRKNLQQQTIHSRKAEPVSPVDVRKFKKLYEPIRAARLDLAQLNRSKTLSPPFPSRREQAVMAAKLGLDANQLQQYSKRENAALTATLRKRRETAVKKGRAVRQSLVDETLSAANAGAIVFPLQPISRELLDAPFLIWPTPLFPLDASAIISNNSSARVHLDRVISPDATPGAAGLEELSFFFRWRNPTSDPMIFSVDGFLVLTGYTEAISIGEYLPTNPTWVQLSVLPFIDVLSEWTQIPTRLAGDTASALYEVVQGDQGLFYQHSKAVSTDIFRGFDLKSGQFVIPGNASVILNLGVWVNYAINNFGAVHVDFSTDAFSIMTPGVLVTQWG